MGDHLVWGPDPEIINLFGVLSIRYYGLMFAIGFTIGYYIVYRMFKEEGRDTKDLDDMLMYLVIGTVIGARLGHCLFYEPEYFLPRPLEMLLPFKWTDGSFDFTGYKGLASHGGIFGVFIAIWLFAKKKSMSFLDLLDKISIPGSFVGACIRLGNFMNSEILGVRTDSPIGVIFERVDKVPRHAAQLYESIAYLLISILLFWVYKQKKYKSGFVFGLFFTLLFMSRFFIEFFKINQVGFEDGMALNMGQILSIPFFLFGVVMMYLNRGKRSAQKST